MNGIKVELWDEVQFMNAREDWGDLLERSSSDKLFMSWEWLYTWWETFSNKDLMTLQIIAAYNSSNILIGIAPLFLMQTKSKQLIKTHRLQFLGNFWRGQETMKTELQDFIVDKESSNQVIQALFTTINSQSNWDEFIMSDLSKNTDTYKVLINDKLLSNSYYRFAEKFDSYYLNLFGDFSSYCKSLSKSTRLKILNRRKILDSLGNVEFLESKNFNIDDNFVLLNNLHIKRWGGAVFENKRLKFNTSVAKLMAENGRLKFTVLYLNKEPISIQYNYLVNKHEYNIQAGFDEGFHDKISLGYLHFGYAIESAFENKTLVYDFLAGEGKNTQYKEGLTNTTLDIVCIQVIRNVFLKSLYRAYDFYRRLTS